MSTLRRSARPARVGAAATTDAVVGSVQGLLRSSRAACVAAAVHRRAAGRQCAQIDVGDARPRQRADVLPSVSAFHHARTVGRRGGVAPAAGAPARAHRHPDSRRNEFPQVGSAFGRGGAPVLRCARQGGELPSRGHGGAVDGAPGVAGRRIALSARDVDQRCGPPCGGADSRAGRLSREVAARPDAGAPRAGGRFDPDRRGRRRRIRRQPDGPPDAAPAAPALCVGHLADADGLPRHAHAACRSRATAAAQSPRGLARSGAGQRPRAQRRAAGARFGVPRVSGTK